MQPSLKKTMSGRCQFLGWRIVLGALFILLLPVSTASATVLPTTITENTTLTTLGSPYTGTSTIESGVTLTIEPGVKLMVGELTVKGRLLAEGTAEAPVLFTASGEKSSGEWERIKFEPGSGASVIDHAEVKYGSWSATKGMIEIVGSSPTIRNSTIRKSGGYGIKVVKGGSPEIANSKFIENFQYAINYGAEATSAGEINIHDNSVEKGGGGITANLPSTASIYGKTLSGNTITGTSGWGVFYNGPDIPGDITQNNVSGNSNNVILAEGTVAHSSTWSNAGAKVALELGVTVASGVTLTMEPGLVLMPGHSITVKGTLKAEGTAEKPIRFTGPSEAATGEWEQIRFEPGSGASVLDHVEAIWGSFSSTKGMIEIVGSSPTIRNSTIRKSGGYGIKVVKGGSPEIANSKFIENFQYAINYGAEATSAGEINIHDNSVEKGGGGITANLPSTASIYGKTLSGNTITGTSGWGVFYNGPDIPGDITQNTLSGNASNGILAEGTVAHSSTWSNGGTKVFLELGVTVASGVTLTMKPGISVVPNHNLTVKGTLKAEGTAVEPVVFSSNAGSTPGAWEQIKFEPGSGASVLDHVEAQYGGWSATKGMLEIVGSSPTIKNSTIRKSGGYGIKVTESGSPMIERNRFRNSTTGGLSYSGTGTLSAPSNDWGCASGPKPAGCGDSVTSNVSWKPAVQLPELAGHCRGKESQCGEGADPVSLATGALDYSHRDLLLTNKSSVPLEFARTYYSGSSADTGLGFGWAQTGLASVTELEGGEVLVVRQDGRQDLFQKAESGYQAPSGVTDALVKVEGTFQLTTLEGTVYRFDSSGRIASITDDHGLKTTYAYNAEGRLTTITDPSAQILTFSYNASNHITLVKDSTGREVKFAYSGAGDLESVTDALGGVTKYAYDSQHRLTSLTDPRGNVILKNTYDSQGRITEQRDGLEDLWKLEYKTGETVVTEPQGGKLTYGFDSQNRVVSETDQLGHTTTTGYDAAGNVSKVIEPGGAEWIFGHDAAGSLTSAKDPAGGERKYEYDSKNRLTHYTDPRGGNWSYEWSAANDPTKITDSEGGETVLTYNASGQPLTLTDPDKHKTEFSYDTRGNELSATDPLGHKTSFEYNNRNYLTAKTRPGLKAETLEVDALGDVLARTTPEGHKTKYAYDANGLPTQVTDPAEDIWKIERNAMERPTAYTDPLGQQAKVSYNGNLKPTKVVNRRGKETSYAYDLANELTEVKRPEGGVWKYGYDSRGNRSAMTDPRGKETTYAYDSLDRMTEAKEPLSVTTKYGYDAGGDLTSVTDPRGNTTGYGYDKLGRLTEVAQPLEEKTTYTYDPAGNELSKATAIGTLQYGYDAANRLTSVKAGESTLRSYGYDAADRRTSATDAAGHKIEIGYTEEGRPNSINDGRGQSLTRTYDSRGNLVKQVDGRGTLEYGYDKLDRMTSLTDPQGKALGFAYDPEGDLTEVSRPNGVTTANLYNEAGRLSETVSKTAEPLAVLESLKYGYDAAGNVTSKVDQRLETETSYAYDSLNRLTEFNPPGEGATSYGYDAAGNRTEAGGTAYSFNALNEPTESSAGTTYSYDGAGRLTDEVNGSEEATFGWDLLDHLAKAETPGGNVTYAFDGLERLSERKSGEATQVFHYGDLGDMATYTANGEGKMTTSYLQGPPGLLEKRSGEATSFPLVDGHGDVTAIAGGAGEVESRQSFDPWGSQLAGPGIEMGYLGAWERPSDPTSGMIQMGARSYAPSLGSFASEDPVFGHLGIGVSSNRYPYVWDNPLNRRDLNGRDVCVPTPLGNACAEDAGSAGESAWEAGSELGSDVGSDVGSLAEESWNATAPTRNWVAGRASDFVKFARHNWDTAVIGSATLGVGAVTVFGTTACLVASDGLGAPECIKGASLGLTATVGGVYATIESTKN